MYALLFFQFALQTVVLNTFDLSDYSTRVAILIISYSIVTVFLSTALITFIEPEYFTRSLMVKRFINLVVISALASLAVFVDDTVSTGIVALGISALMFVVLAASLTVNFLVKYVRLLKQVDKNSGKEIRRYLSMLLFSGIVVIMMGPGAFAVPFVPDSVNVAYFAFLVICVLFCYLAYDAFSRNISTVYELASHKAFVEGSQVTYLDEDEDSSATEPAHPVRTSFKDVCAYMDRWIEKKGYLESGITTDLLAGRVPTSRKYISRYFNEVAQLPFRDFVNNNRIEESKRLMRSTSLDDNDISKVIGFTSRAQFVNLFKTITGVTPSVWRKSNEN